MNMQVVLISGKQGAGKTTLAQNIEAVIRCKKSWACIQETFAKSIYDMHDYCRSVLVDAGVTLENEVKDGNLLQLLGTEWGRNTLGEDIWVNVLKGRVYSEFNKGGNRILQQHSLDGTPLENVVYVVSDCRFENELNSFPNALRVRLVCDRKIRKTRCSMWRENETHASEVGLDKVDACMFDMILDTGSYPPGGLADLVVAKLEKNTWLERRAERL